MIGILFRRRRDRGSRDFIFVDPACMKVRIKGAELCVRDIISIEDGKIIYVDRYGFRRVRHIGSRRGSEHEDSEELGEV